MQEMLSGARIPSFDRLAGVALHHELSAVPALLAPVDHAAIATGFEDEGSAPARRAVEGHEVSVRDMQGNRIRFLLHAMTGGFG